MVFVLSTWSGESNAIKSLDQRYINGIKIKWLQILKVCEFPTFIESNAQIIPIKYKNFSATNSNW